MHSRSKLSRPSPKRSLSCAGLDGLDEFLHSSDNARASPNRKRHQSLHCVSAIDCVAPSLPSRYTSLPTPTSETSHRPELSPFDDNSSSDEELQQCPSSSFEIKYPQTSSHHDQTNAQYRSFRSNDQDNDCDEEDSDGFNDEYDDVDASYGRAHNYQNRDYVSVPNVASVEPHDMFASRMKPAHDAPAAKLQDHNMYLLPSHRSSSSECLSREEFLIQAFGPSGFKLHDTSVSNNDDFDESLSDDSSNNDREQSMSNHEETNVDADTELKMSFNELEADIRGAMHQDPQQHSTRLPELTGLPHQSFASPSHGPFGLSRIPSFLQSNQDIYRVSSFAQSQDVRPHFVSCQEDSVYFRKDQHHQSPSCTSSLKSTPQSQGSTGIQTSTKWLCDEDDCLREAVARFGGKNWKMIAETIGNGRTDVQCLHRWNKVLKPGLIKGPWTPEEDRILTSLITRYGVGKIRWCDLALHLPGRIGKQCRERWCNHLDSRIRKGQWTLEEDDMLFRWQQKLGNKWSEIAKLLPGRTENAVKNRFNSAARRKWLTNQANKSSPSPVTQTTPTTQTPVPHIQLPRHHHPLLHSSSMHQEGNIYNVHTEMYGSAKVSPLPSTEALLEHHPHKMISPCQNFLQPMSPRKASSPRVLLPSDLNETRSFCPAYTMVGEQNFEQQDHDKSVEPTKGYLKPLATPPPAFVPPPLNSFFSSPMNISTDANCSFHQLENEAGGVDASMSPAIPFADHRSSQVQQHSPVNGMLLAKNTPDDIDAENSVGLSLLQLKEEKTEEGDFVLQTTPDVPVASSATDPSVHMDDDNMNSFLDSVALELDDMME